MSEYTYATIDSPLGRLELVSDGDALTRLSIEGPDYLLQHGGRPGSPDAIITQAISELAEYFAGKRTEFTVPVALVGTPFQQDIWLALLGVPFSQTATYGELALAAGHPKAARAVGGAVGANPVAIIVPCHRILASDRKLTGYSNGRRVETKKQLLVIEQASHRS